MGPSPGAPGAAPVCAVTPGMENLSSLVPSTFHALGRFCPKLRFSPSACYPLPGWEPVPAGQAPRPTFTGLSSRGGEPDFQKLGVSGLPLRMDQCQPPGHRVTSAVKRVTAAHGDPGDPGCAQNSIRGVRHHRCWSLIVLRLLDLQRPSSS